MRRKVSRLKHCNRRQRADGVQASRWMHDRWPNWIAILSAQDLARLTRRAPWIASVLTLLGRCPNQQRLRTHPLADCSTPSGEGLENSCGRTSHPSFARGAVSARKKGIEYGACAVHARRDNEEPAMSNPFTTLIELPSTRRGPSHD
jgi:hypothetical protein